MALTFAHSPKLKQFSLYIHEPSFLRIVKVGSSMLIQSNEMFFGYVFAKVLFIYSNGFSG